MVTAHLVNHTHWDREWYFTIMDAQVLSEQLFTEVLDELEKNPAANFTLDGQVSIVDEYIELHPEAKKRIKKLVAENRLFIGPWFTQTDALIPDAESIIRNLVIGINDCQKNYGSPMMVGYLPDTFGFNAQMPTLLQQVGIDNFIFWRGINFEKQTNSVYFQWRGLSDKQVIALNFPFGYFTGQITPEAKREIHQFVNERYDPAVKFAAEHGNQTDVLMPSGIDQMNIVKNLEDTVKKINQNSQFNTIIDDYPSFVALMRQKKSNLPTYQGELRLPTYARVHRSIGSVRHELKKQNFLLEQKILKRIEPLAVIGRKAGVTIGNGLLIKLWKKLLECQPHDSLGGCVSDNVAADIMHRFKEANQIADGIENMIKKKIADFLHLKSDEILLFNTEPYHFKGRKVIQLVTPNLNITINGMKNCRVENYRVYPKRNHVLMMTPKGKEFADEPAYIFAEISGEVDLPGLSYTVLKVRKNDFSLPTMEKKLSAENFEITHGNQSLYFKNGSINLQVGQDVYTSFLKIVDSGNDGDTYDYSPLTNGPELSLPLQRAFVQKNGQHQQLVVNGAARLPLSLKDRQSSDPHLGNLAYQLIFQFNEEGQVCVHLNLDNQIFSHRLRVVFSPNIISQTALAEIQAGYLEIKNEPIPKNWTEKFVEKPVNLYNFDKTVTIKDQQRYFTYWSAGQKEFEYRDQKLFITLMSTTGQLGKPDLAWRPGRASGDTTNQGHIMMATPLAQELGKHEFDFAFQLVNGKFTMEHNNILTRKWLSPSVSYQKQNLNVFINRLDNKIWETEDNPIIPRQQTLLELSDDLDVAAIYPAYRSAKYFVIRIQNLTNHQVLIPPKLLQIGKVVDALENPVQDTKIIKPYDLISILLPFALV